MIGIVVVSHSRALAEAAVALAEQMIPADARPALAIAAGIDDGGLGTDATAVASAISEVDSPGGNLVLVDLGSAVLSAELALELLPEETSDRTLISPAPFVEGLLAAVVTASTNADLDAVATEAADALSGKRSHLSEDPDRPPPGGGGAPQELSAARAAPDGSGAVRLTGDRGASPQAGPPVTEVAVPASESIELVVVVPNEHGLHARPSAAFARIVASYQASIEVSNLSRARRPLNGASVAALTRLDARCGDRLALSVHGPQAAALVRALLAFAADNFGDPKPGAEAPAPPAPAVPVRKPGGRGLAVQGRLSRVDLDEGVPRPGGAPQPVAQTAGAVELFDAAVSVAGEQLREIVGIAEQRVSADAAAMVSVQLQLLRDPTIATAVRQRISSGISIVQAWAEHLGRVRGQLESLDNDYLRARGQDITSLERRVRLLLLGREPADPRRFSGVLLVTELDAPTAVLIEADQVSGVVTRRGGEHGHGVLIARARSIPIVVDAGEALDNAPEGSLVSWPPRVVRAGSE